MKLPTSSIDLIAQLMEFDVWLTPALGEIRDSERFAGELDLIAGLFESLGLHNNQFANVGSCHPDAIADQFVYLVEAESRLRSGLLLRALASVLFLVTGKSDNNAKCQLPVFLRDNEWITMPTAKVSRRKGGETISVVEARVPRVLKSEVYMDNISKLQGYPEVQQRLLRAFIGFVLSDNSYVEQFWAIGRSYFLLKEFGKERSLLAPLVIFQVRGSVSASGGHGPEYYLRERLVEWGLRVGVDFNVTDVVPTSLAESARDLRVSGGLLDSQLPLEDDSDGPLSQTRTEAEKKRGYDCVLPYRADGWSPSIFIQSQFYAGDSGSVSHKNVDQTRTARTKTREAFPQAKFIEFVDGAGYFSSLNGDLRKLISMESTTTFVQLKSIPIRLRRELQQIGFLTPLEYEHALLRSNGALSEAHGLLLGEGYSRSELDRVWNICVQGDFIKRDGPDRAVISEGRWDIVRRYFLLDVAAIFGDGFPTPKPTAVFLVPGFGAFYGIKIDELVRQAIDLAPMLKTAWSDPAVILEDMRWLCEMGWAMSR